MTSILISTDDPEIGTSVAKQLSEMLGYDYLGPPLLEKVAQSCETGVDKLQSALNTQRSNRVLFNKSMRTRLACIQAATLDRLLDDGVVCEGLAAHLYARGVSHILTVRLLSGKKARQEKIVSAQGISLKKAQRIVEREDRSQNRWAEKAFGLDETDAALYDMVLSLEQIGTDKAVEVIGGMAGYRKFKLMTYSYKCLEDLALAGRLRVLLMRKFSDFCVDADGGKVVVKIKCPQRQKAKTAGEIKVLANEIPEIKFVEVHTVGKLSDIGALKAGAIG